MSERLQTFNLSHDKNISHNKMGIPQTLGFFDINLHPALWIQNSPKNYTHFSP